MRSKSTLQTVGGQSVWSLAQAAVVLILARAGEFELIGVYTLGLAVFSLICLFGSFNLRTIVVVGSENKITPLSAVFLRITVSLAALLVTALVLMLSTSLEANWFVALGLISVRLFDQVSDVSVAFFQRDGHYQSIAKSYLVRGCASLLGFSPTYIFNQPISVSVGTTIILLVFFLFFFEWRELYAKYMLGELHFAAIRLPVLNRSMILMATYPTLDSLHFNSFRFALFYIVGAQTAGVISVAQTLFVPFQLIATAIGFQFLPTAVRNYKIGNLQKSRMHALLGILTGFAVSCSFLGFSALVPDELLGLAFREAVPNARAYMFLVSIAMFPIVAVGFSSLSLVAEQKQFAYISAPVMGISIFWITVGLASFSLGDILLIDWIAWGFFVSASMRLLLSTVSVFWPAKLNR